MSLTPTVPLPHATRQQVFNALFDQKIKQIAPPTGTTWKLQSQRLRTWDEVPAANQPAIFLYRSIQNASRTKAYGVTKWHWRCSVWIYYRVDGYTTDSTYPDQLTDSIIDNIEQIFQTDPLLGADVLNSANGYNTLDGIVTDVWIDGNIVFDSGLTDGQAVIVVPLSILI